MSNNFVTFFYSDDLKHHRSFGNILQSSHLCLHMASLYCQQKTLHRRAMIFHDLLRVSLSVVGIHVHLSRVETVAHWFDRCAGWKYGVQSLAQMSWQTNFWELSIQPQQNKHWQTIIYDEQLWSWLMKVWRWMWWWLFMIDQSCL